MVKKLLFSFALLALTCSLSFAQKGRVYLVDNFSKVSLALPVDVNVQFGSKCEVKAVGPASDIEAIVVEKDGSSLILKTNRKFLPHRFNKETKIFVTLPALEKASIAGSGDIYVRGCVTGNSFSISIAGSGDVAVEKLTVDKFSVSIAGSGDVEVKSKSTAAACSYTVAGSGDIECRNVVAREAKVRVAGSGDAEVYATDSFDADIVGSGDVVCGGNPKNVKKTKMGSGSISFR